MYSFTGFGKLKTLRIAQMLSDLVRNTADICADI
jgi:hypothetical protein